MTKVFFYKFNGGERKGVRYLTCYQKFCKGSASIRQNGSIVSGKDHSPNCLPNNSDDERLNEKIKFRKVLLLRSKQETTRLRTIYDEECIRNRTGALHYGWPVAEISMRLARKKATPALPQTLIALADFLDINPERYKCCERPFYQERIVDGLGKCSIIFGCEELVNGVIRLGGNELHADATFKVVPSKPKSRQIFIMHIIIQNHSIPIMYALMESKTQEAYRLVLEKCKLLFPQMAPIIIMTDYEKALKNAFLSVYPNANLYSCWFHYVQSLMRNIRRKGLTTYLKHSHEAQMCIKMFAALALLPANRIEEGYQCIRHHARNNNLQLTSFFNYFNSFWLRTVGPETFSVHGIARRTNNNVENFHGRLKEKFQISHPNLWTFLKHLNELSLKNHITIAQLSQGQKVSRPIKVKYIANSERIKNASAQLSLGTINVSEFLIQCSHTAETYIREELNWYTLVEQNLEVNNADLTQSDGDDNVSVAEDIAHPVVNFADLTQSDGDHNVSVAEDIAHPVVNFADLTQSDGDDVSVAEDIARPVVNFADLTQSDGDDVSVAEDIAHPVVNFADPTQYDRDNSVSGAEDNIMSPIQENSLVAEDSDGSGDLFITRHVQAVISNSPTEANWNEDDFILQEELDPDMVNMMEIDNRRRAIEIQNIPFVQVPINLPLPSNRNMCVVCKDLERTHALIPCGHTSLCGNCVELLHPKRCPLCNENFSSTLRIWS